MTETDLLNDILTSNPNEPAAKGAVLLLRTEMKSEFKTVGLKFDGIDQKFERIDQRFERIENRLDHIDDSLELIAQQIAILVARNA